MFFKMVMCWTKFELESYKVISF